MHSSHRKVFVSVTVATLFLLIAHFTFEPLIFGDLRALDDGIYRTGKSRQKETIPFYRPHVGHESTNPNSPPKHIGQHHGSVAHKVIVVASLKDENTSWVTENFPEWQHAIYNVDNPDAPLHTHKNKGREANVYLTYIVDHYHNLPSIMIFIHSHENHDHGTRDVKGLDYNNILAIRSLNLDYVQRTGYANLRCILEPGCPAEIMPFREEWESDPLRPQERAMVGAWKELFMNENVPPVIATPCCAQFAVSRDQVLKRERVEYMRFATWLMDTSYDDFTSGRVFEYLWHIIFGREPG